MVAPRHSGTALKWVRELASLPAASTTHTDTHSHTQSHSPQVEAEMKKLTLVYNVYAEHKENVSTYALQLWSELDVTKVRRLLVLFG